MFYKSYCWMVFEKMLGLFVSSLFSFLSLSLEYLVAVNLVLIRESSIEIGKDGSFFGSVDCCNFN